MEKAKLMQLEIEKKRKLPTSVKENINTNIFQNLLAATVLMAYFCIVDITYFIVENVKFEEYLKYFSLIIIFVTVIDFEVAYRKNSIKLCIIGIEFLASGIVSLYIPYIYIHTNDITRFIVMILPAILIFYYLFKSFAIFKQKQFQYQNNLSDVKEILKDTENTSYIDEESTKSYKQKTREEEKIRREILQEQKIRKRRKQIQNQLKNANKRK